MLISRLQELPHSPNRAVIINYNTRLVSTLSLLSALRYADMPVLVIDCESTDGSFYHFNALLKHTNFDLLSAPLRNHGLTLDWLFPNVNADFVLLIDSDLEILDYEIISFLKKYTSDSQIFGSGFINGPGVLNSPEFEDTPIYKGLYFERPWMPLVYFRTSAIIEALNCGISFTESTVRRKSLFKRLLTLFGGSPSDNHLQLLAQHKILYYDTGALVYDFLRYKKHYFFTSIPEPLHHLHTMHFFGTTRKVVSENDINNGGGNGAIEAEVLIRLAEKYSYSEPDVVSQISRSVNPD